MEEKIIDIQGLTKRFGTFTAVNNISFSVGKGEIFGFLGANGAGKSTAIRMLCGLSRPTAGSGTVAGFDIIRQYEQIKRHIGYMSQKFSLYDDLTPMENIYLFGGIYGMSRKDSEFQIKRNNLSTPCLWARNKNSLFRYLYSIILKLCFSTSLQVA